MKKSQVTIKDIRKIATWESYLRSITWQANLENIKLPGKTGRLAFESTIKGFVKSGKISEHDALIGRKLAFVLTGGDKGGPMSGVDEQYLLDIERETFLSLCGEEKSKARISHMLKTSKPLRN